MMHGQKNIKLYFCHFDFNRACFHFMKKRFINSDFFTVFIYYRLLLLLVEHLLIPNKVKPEITSTYVTKRNVIIRSHLNFEGRAVA
jgi:hypothetical protein